MSVRFCKLLTLFVALGIVGFMASIASAEWSWVSGSNATFNQGGIYGTRQIFSTMNAPGARDSLAAWFDSVSGLGFVFGGEGYINTSAASSNSGSLNDLFAYNYSSNEWSWLSGSSTNYAQGGTYGTRGEFSPDNTPGARFGHSAWFDSISGLGFVFGGVGYVSSAIGGNLNDLFAYNYSSNSWCWLSGSSTSVSQGGTYGTQGIFSPANVPGSRFFHTSWFDSVSGLGFVFGGATSPLSGRFNDLFAYNYTSNQWCWLSGNNTTVDVPGSYGTQGVFSHANTPGSLSRTAAWFDSVSGLAFVFGGLGCGNSDCSGEPACLNDLFAYNYSSNEWVWLSGSSSATNQSAVYGTQGIFSRNSTPAATCFHAAWFDAQSRLGFVFGGSGVINQGFKNDLFAYAFTTNEWCWLSGGNTTSQGGDYGTRGVFSDSIRPGARSGHAAWFDSGFGLGIVLGGDGYITTSAGELNSVFAYNATISAPEPPIPEAAPNAPPQPLPMPPVQAPLVAPSSPPQIPPELPAVCSSPSIAGLTCIADGVYVPLGASFVGNVSIPVDTSLMLAPGSNWTVHGTVTLSGTLVAVAAVNSGASGGDLMAQCLNASQGTLSINATTVSNSTRLQINLGSFDAQCSNGTFGRIQVDGSVSMCETVEAEQNQTAAAHGSIVISLLYSQSDSSACSPPYASPTLNVALVSGVAVGAAVAAVVIILVVVFTVPKCRRRALPFNFEHELAN